MKDFVILGTGDLADLFADTIVNDMNRNLAGYVVDDKFYTNAFYKGLPVRKFEEIQKWFPPGNYTLAIGFLGERMYSQRYEKYLKLKEMGYELENVIHSTAVISENCKIGDGNVFLQYTVVASGARVGNCNVICPKAYVCHDVLVGNANYFGPGVSTTGYAEIGNNCFLGVNCSVNNKVKVADFTFVGGGIFLTNDTKPYEIYVAQRSVPMKRIRSIDFQMFTSRKTEKLENIEETQQK